MTVRWRVGMAFFGLCLISGSEWLIGQLWTNPLSPILQLVYACAPLALIFAALAAFRGSRHRARRDLLSLCIWGAVLLGLPTLVIAGAGGRVERLTAILLFTGLPSVIVFLTAQARAGFGATDSPMRLLLPTLAGVGGAALLLPFVTPANAAGWLWLGLLVSSPVLAGFAAIQLHRLLAKEDVFWAAAAMSGATALLALAASVFDPSAYRVRLTREDLQFELVSIVLFSGPVVLLTAWLLREMEPVAFASRYVLVPLITIAEGYLVLRPEVTWTTPAGLVLMALSVGYLLRARAAEV